MLNKYNYYTNIKIESEINMNVKMKKIVSITIVSILILALVLPTAIAAFAESDSKQIDLRVFNWGEYISNGEDDSMDIVKEFEAQNKDIKVTYTTFATNEEMYAKIANGSANYDIVIPSDYMIEKMIEEDLLAELDYANIPNFSYIDETVKQMDFDKENKFSVPYTWGTVGIIYNTKKVTDPVDSWDILWDEKYKGQILMFDNPRDAFAIAAKRLGYSLNSTDKDEIKKMGDELKAQKPVLQAYVMDEIFNKLSSGEALIAPYYAGDAITMIEDNPDLAFSVPAEGTNQFVDSMCVLKSSQNKEAAERFINFLLEPEIMAENIGYIGYSSPSASARELLDDEMKNSPISYPSDEILSNCEAFISLPKDTLAYMQDLWVEVKAEDKDSSSTMIIIIIAVVVVLGVVAMIVLKKRKKNDY